jgi:hypothetical protein
VIQSELAALLQRIGEVTARDHVPVTVLLLPNYEQITRGAGFAFQDEATRLAIAGGLDVCDIRDPFVNYADKPALFIPDKHFSAIGNRIVLAELVKHFHALGSATDVKLPEDFPE